MKLRVGVVGLGDAWQHRHRPALWALADRFEVRAICEQVGHRARQAAREFGAEAVDGFHVLARREDIDAILLLGAQWYGSLPVLAACEAGKAVYCSYGLSLDPDEAQMLKRRVDEAGIAFMAEFPRRQAPATLRLKELIATRLGPPQLLFSHRRLGADAVGGDAAGCSRRNSLVQELVELVDWCCYVVGQGPVWVSGTTHCRTDRPCEVDYQMLSLGFADPTTPNGGAVAQVSCGRYIPAEWPEAISYRPLASLQVACRSGIAFVDLPATLVWFDESGRHQEPLDSERTVGEQLLTQFHRAVTSLVRRTSDLEEAYRALTIVQQAGHSHFEGKRMELP